MRSGKLHRQIFLTGLHTAVIVPHLFEKGYIFVANYFAQIALTNSAISPYIPNQSTKFDFALIVHDKNSGNDPDMRS